MKLIIDENLPPGLARSLQSGFPGSTHVHACGLGAIDDRTVWDYAKARGFTIVTKDSDYEILSVLLGPPPKVIWLRTGNCTTAYLGALFALHANSVQVFGDSGSDAVLVLR